jgi:uncharacterized protein (TIGR02246 family)
MALRTALRVAASLTVATWLGAIPSSDGALGPRDAPSPPAQQTSSPVAAWPGTGDADRPTPSADEKAIRAVDEQFVRDYNRGDSKALAALFTEDAEAIEAEGDRYRGRHLIERQFAETFAASAGVKIAIEAASIRFLSPDVAREEGQTLITPAKEPKLVRPFTVLFVKRNGQWLLSSVREEADPLVAPHDRLSELQWMIGDWVDNAPDSEVRVHCRWSEDGNFLMRSFTVKQGRKAVMTVNQRIGWDPLARRIRSWEFDSEGGFGEGTWSRAGRRWVIKYSGVRPDGVAASSTNVMIKERPDLVRWSSTDRVVGDGSLHGVDAHVLVRVAPAPRTPASGRSTPSSPNAGGR